MGAIVQELLLFYSAFLGEFGVGMLQNLYGVPQFYQTSENVILLLNCRKLERRITLMENTRTRNLTAPPDHEDKIFNYD